jgi:hypothetical protein
MSQGAPHFQRAATREGYLTLELPRFLHSEFRGSAGRRRRDSADATEAVGAPLVAASTLVDEEEPFGMAPSLRCGEGSWGFSASPRTVVRWKDDGNYPSRTHVPAAERILLNDWLPATVNLRR